MSLHLHVVSAHLKTIQEELKTSSSCYRDLTELKEELNTCHNREDLYKKAQNELQVKFELFSHFYF